MKLPEEEQKAYERYQEDLHYQASLYESSFVDGLVEGTAEGREQALKQIAIKLAKTGVATDIIAGVTGLTLAEINLALSENS